MIRSLTKTLILRKTSLPIRLVGEPKQPWNVIMGAMNCKNFGTVADESSDRGTATTPSTMAVDQQPQTADYVEDIVCNETDLNDNEMKSFPLGEHGKVLIARQNGEWSAVGTKCTHYGAPLDTGSLGNGRVRCPWHGACFNLKSGDIEDFPGMDSIPCYQVKVEDGKIKVKARKRDLEANKRVKEMAKRDLNNSTTFAIIGGGPSGATCAEALRQEGFTGRIVMICRENYLPYDRVKVSKAMSLGIERIQLRTQMFYDDNGIETFLGVEATALDTSAKEISLSTGGKLKYDKAYIATGSKARRAPIPGANLRNVFIVQTVEDSQAISNELSEDKTLVILGASFIGIESAAYCVDKVKSVTVIVRDQVLPAFGELVGDRIKRFCEAKGVLFRMKNGIKACISDEDGNVKSVELNDGEVLPADLCIMGIGTTYYTDFLKDSGINLNANGSIDTNEFLQSNDPDVYVGGDIASAPILSSGNTKATIGHFGLAQSHGKIAAINMAGTAKPLKTVPFFWHTIFGVSVRYAGHGKPADVHVVGDLEKMDFAAFFLDKNDKAIAVATCGQSPGPAAADFAEFLAQGKTWTKSDLISDPYAFRKQLNQ